MRPWCLGPGDEQSPVELETLDDEDEDGDEADYGEPATVRYSTRRIVARCRECGTEDRFFGIDGRAGFCLKCDDFRLFDAIGEVETQAE